MLNNQHISSEKKYYYKNPTGEIAYLYCLRKLKVMALRPRPPLPSAITELHSYYCSFSVDVLVIDFICTAETKGLQCIVNLDVDGCIS